MPKLAHVPLSSYEDFDSRPRTGLHPRLDQLSIMARLTGARARKGLVQCIPQGLSDPRAG